MAEGTVADNAETIENGAEDQATEDFYRRSLLALHRGRVPHLLGGAYALAPYTGIKRCTKDLDIFLRERDCKRALEVLAAAGCKTEVAYPHWLAKARCGKDMVDLIYSSGNGIAIVDDEWFAHATKDHVLGVPVLLCPVEEMIWSKAFVMERERFDGADVLHLLHARSAELDWPRLMKRFEPHWRVLFCHLILFGYVYPSELSKIPSHVMETLTARVNREQQELRADERVCRGTLLSRAQFLVDIERWAYEDARLDPEVQMSDEHIAQWTDAIADEVRSYDAQGKHSPGGRG
jgi:hypothetical protein